MLLKFFMPVFGMAFALVLFLRKEKMNHKKILLSGFIISLLLDAIQGFTFTLTEIIWLAFFTALFYLGFHIGRGILAYMAKKKSPKIRQRAIQSVIATGLLLLIMTPIGSNSFSYNKSDPEQEITVDYGNAKVIWKYLRRNLGCSRAAAAGVLGNMYAESMFDPKAVEGNGVGHGIGQWSWGRWYGEDGLEVYSANQEKDWSDIHLQLKFLRHEVVENNSMEAYYKGGFRRFKKLRHVDGENGSSKVFFSAFEYGSYVTYDEFASDDFQMRFATRSKRLAVAKYIYNDKRRFP